MNEPSQDTAPILFFDRSELSRPEGPILSAQAEGLGCLQVGNVGPERAIQQRLFFFPVTPIVIVVW
jgi:hypothetical protein